MIGIAAMALPSGDAVSIPASEDLEGDEPSGAFLASSPFVPASVSVTPPPSSSGAPASPTPWAGVLLADEQPRVPPRRERDRMVAMAGSCRHSNMPHA